MELNKIYNENSYELIKEFEDKSIDCIYTDIPYAFHTDTRKIYGTSSIHERIVKKAQSLNFMAEGIDYNILYEFVRVMKKINCFIWCSYEQIYPIMKFFLETIVDEKIRDKKCSFKILTWHKTNPQPTNNGWLPDTEFCLYFYENGVKTNRGYYLKHQYFISKVNIGDKNEFLHPTIKPLEVVKQHILHVTQPHDLIVDFFAGSGTTCVAAQETGRNYIGIEKEEKWYKVCCDRCNGINTNGQLSIYTDFNHLEEFSK